eukprot:14195383-Alexandrium_andersonii.AAC.1
MRLPSLLAQCECESDLGAARSEAAFPGAPGAVVGAWEWAPSSPSPLPRVGWKRWHVGRVPRQGRASPNVAGARGPR